MAEEIRGKLGDVIKRMGPPDSVTELYAVPASHKQDLDGADLACRHIADGTDTGDGFYVRRLGNGKTLAVCEKCNTHFEGGKAAGAGR
jgi:hypothetical protein